MQTKVMYDHRTMEISCWSLNWQLKKFLGSKMSCERANQCGDWKSISYKMFFYFCAGSTFFSRHLCICVHYLQTTILREITHACRFFQMLVLFIKNKCDDNINRIFKKKCKWYCYKIDNMLDQSNLYIRS